MGQAQAVEAGPAERYCMRHSLVQGVYSPREVSRRMVDVGI